MPEQKERIIIALAVSISAILLAVVAILAILDRQAAEQIPAEHHREHTLVEIPDKSPYEHPAAKPLAESPGELAKTHTKPAAGPRISLNDVIRSARYWGPAYKSWFGEMAPDFTLTDITGKQHKLSDYRGKNVMIIFWATWCRPCIMEIPHLIALRNTVSEDKLAMLAISNERQRLVKRFAILEKINYTLFASNTNAMPAPFRNVNAIPCSFFIDPGGKIKLATSGVLQLGDIKAILQAE